MDCPRCMGALVAKWAGDVEIDVCLDGCGGWWLDRGELRKLTARGHRMGPKLEEREPPGMPRPISGVGAGFSDGPAAGGGSVGFGDSPRPSYAPTQMRCPRDGAVLQEVMVGGSAAITVDRCPGCGGFWIDHGELDRIVETAGRRAAEPGVDFEAELGKSTLLSGSKTESLFEALGSGGKGDDRGGTPLKSKKRRFFEMVGDLLEEVIDI